jgi:adenosylcobinamide kinase / adenosylcobinamide-phosphate guanylyltransferase
MAKLMLVTGGCRSGKSDYAQRLAESLGTMRAYVATAPAVDDEMRQRIAVHRRARADRGWQTIEEQLDLAAVFRGNADYDLLLVDCITLWINNLMYAAEHAGGEVTEADVAARCEAWLAAAAARRGWVVVVTNEVGLGIVPDNPAARRYRDLVGRANQVIAARAETVTLVSCGIPWHLKQEQAA